MKVLKFCMLVSFTCLIIAGCGEENKPLPETDSSPDLKGLEFAVKQFPDSMELLYNLMDEYRDRGMYDSAISLLDQRIKVDTGDAHLWSMKATLYFENGDTLAAANALEGAIDIYPMPEYLVALGTIYAGLKNTNSILIANHLLNTGSRKYFDDAYFIKGLYYNFDHQYGKAISVLDSCLALNYNYMYAYREKAIALYHLARYEEAVAVLIRAVTFQNSYDEGYYWLGRNYEKLNNPEKAIESYQNALLYDPNYIEAKEALKRLQKEKEDSGK